MKPLTPEEIAELVDSENPMAWLEFLIECGRDEDDGDQFEQAFPPALLESE